MAYPCQTPWTVLPSTRAAEAAARHRHKNRQRASVRRFGGRSGTEGGGALGSAQQLRGATKRAVHLTGVGRWQQRMAARRGGNPH